MEEVEVAAANAAQESRMAELASMHEDCDKAKVSEDRMFGATVDHRDRALPSYPCSVIGAKGVSWMSPPHVHRWIWRGCCSLPASTIGAHASTS